MALIDFPNDRMIQVQRVHNVVLTLYFGKWHRNIDVLSTWFYKRCFNIHQQALFPRYSKDFTYVKESNALSDSGFPKRGFWIPTHGFRAPCFGFRIPNIVFRIPRFSFTHVERMILQRQFNNVILCFINVVVTFLKGVDHHQ